MTPHLGSKQLLRVLLESNSDIAVYALTSSSICLVDRLSHSPSEPMTTTSPGLTCARHMPSSDQAAEAKASSLF